MKATNALSAQNKEWPTWPYFSPAEREAVHHVLLSGKVNYWTGEECQKFEKEFSEYLGNPYAVALANGTLALEAALYGLDIGKGDEVITTSRTFIATAGAVVLRGAKPIFADVDTESQNITAKTISAVLSPRTKAIIVVHLAGWPCEMDEILALAKAHSLWVIEDCAQALGALYQGKPVGSFGDIAAFSFCQDKIITTGGEGGMVTMKDETLWKKIWSYKDHGKSYDTVYKKTHPVGFRWLHEDFGSNWRMTEMQAAIGRQQLQQLPSYLDARQRNAHLLTTYFMQYDFVRTPCPPIHIQHAYYKYYIFIEPKKLPSYFNRDQLLLELNALGVPCFSGSCSEIYQEIAFLKANLQPDHRLAIAKQLGETSLMFLVHPTLTENHMQEMLMLIEEVFKHIH